MGTAGQRVLLVKAGATHWDEAGRVQGVTDLPLTVGGISGVRGMIAGLCDARLGGVFCGPDESSVQTAQMLREARGGKIHVVPELSEVDLGLWEGLRLTDLEERFTRSCQRWFEDPSSVTAPEGESLLALRERFLPALERAVAKSRPRAPIAVVLRPIVLALARCHLQQRPCSELWQLVWNAPASVWVQTGVEVAATPTPREETGATDSLSTPAFRGAVPAT
jgi:broad specificity phosphatase PhoE